MLVDFIIASVVTCVIFGAHAVLSSLSSDAKYRENERKSKENMADIDPETGDYTSKSDGSRRTKGGCLIHY